MNDQQDESCCPLPHRESPDRPRRSTAGSVLCAGHCSAVLRVLGELSTFDYDADQLIEAKTARHDAAPLTGTGEKPLPIDPRAADLRVDVRDGLALWSRLVAEERLIQGPRTEQGSAALSAFLRRHYDWSLAQPWVDDYATEILELGRRAHSLLNPSGRRQFQVGQCVEDGCGGRLWALLTPADPYADAASELACDACDRRIPANEWLTYGRRAMAKKVA